MSVGKSMISLCLSQISSSNMTICLVLVEEFVFLILPGQEIVAPPPPPDVAQSHLYERLGLLLPKQAYADDATSSLGGSSGFSSYAPGDPNISDVDSLSPVPCGNGEYIRMSI